MESNEPKKVRSLCYSPAFLRSKLTCQTVSIPGLIPIPNIVMTDTSKKKLVVSEVRTLFNNVTKTNVDEFKMDLRKIVIEFLTKTSENNIPEEMNKIANEILQNFIVSESNIKLYIQMLNAIFNVAVNHIDPISGKPVRSKPIAHYFMDNCRTLIFKYISEEHIRKLATRDQEDEDELDLFNKEKAKVCNLIITICCLYDQRNTPDIKLTALQVYNIINVILNKYTEITIRMKKLGNPYEGEECVDELEYDYLNRMCTLYYEQIIIFLDLEYESFINDKTIVQEKVMIDNNSITQDKFLSDLVTRFKNEVYPNVVEPHLKQKCEKFSL